MVSANGLARTAPPAGSGPGTARGNCPTWAHRQEHRVQERIFERTWPSELAVFASSSRRGSGSMRSRALASAVLRQSVVFLDASLQMVLECTIPWGLYRGSVWASMRAMKNLCSSLRVVGGWGTPIVMLDV